MLHSCLSPALPPAAGRKILTTAQDNRLRVWDYLYSTNQARAFICF